MVEFLLILAHKKEFYRIHLHLKGSSQTIKNITSLKKFKKVYPKLNIGDALIHSCLVVHGSHKNNSNMSRKGLTFQFKTKILNMIFQKLKNMKKLQEQINLREKINLREISMPGWEIIEKKKEIR